MINYSDEYVEMLAKVAMKTLVDGGSDQDAMRAMLTKHEDEQALAWETTCGGCRRLLDRLYEQEEVDKAKTV